MLMVKEYFDGEFNVTPCKDMASAKFLMKKCIKSLKNYEHQIIADIDNYFQAEIAGNLYSLEIVDTQIFDIAQIDNLHRNI